MPCNIPFVIEQCYTNITFNLQCSAIQISYNIFPIKPYTFDTNVEDINPETYV